ncbi:uncharacterized protein LOC125042152 [Penaeus chinensis]|uniref:uncharacterized protein LOC125042152 n=1 Tax=Penaeus chinensis TaxID=139456 RepID=UPI001FB60600|nr:uncharacterized protein LOC125042152 [Penaeus chinensis]
MTIGDTKKGVTVYRTCTENVHLVTRKPMINTTLINGYETQCRKKHLLDVWYLYQGSVRHLQAKDIRELDYVVDWLKIYGRDAVAAVSWSIACISAPETLVVASRADQTLGRKDGGGLSGLGHLCLCLVHAEGLIVEILVLWSQGLLFHQAAVDCARAAILIPLGRSIYNCVPVAKCSLVETAFLLLVTVSTINMLTTVLNDAPLLPEDSDQKQMPLLMESPQCVLFGTFMIWFASITINLGPTFLSGALAANIDEVHNAPSCPLITGPLRHYVLNVLWIVINVLVVLLTVFHLYKLYRDLSNSSLEAVRIASLVTTMISVTQPQNQDPEAREHRQVNSYINRMEREGVERVKMFVVVTVAYVVFWGPLFLVTLLTPSGGKSGLSHEVTLHVAYVHAFVNPALFLALHKGLRKAVTDIMCCHCSSMYR